MKFHKKAFAALFSLDRILKLNTKDIPKKTVDGSESIDYDILKTCFDGSTTNPPFQAKWLLVGKRHRIRTINAIGALDDDRLPTASTANVSPPTGDPNVLATPPPDAATVPPNVNTSPGITRTTPTLSPRRPDPRIIPPSGFASALAHIPEDASIHSGTSGYTASSTASEQVDPGRWQERLAYRQALLVKRNIPKLEKWDEQLDSFPAFREDFDGKMHVALIGYIVNIQFCQAYKTSKTGDTRAIREEAKTIVSKHLRQADVNSRQFKQDRAVLHGALRIVFPSGVAKLFVKGEDKFHSPIAYLNIVSEYAFGGDVGVLTEKYQGIVATRYDPAAQSLTQWITQFQNAFAELADLGTTFKEEYKIRQLCQFLRISGGQTNYLSTHIRSTFMTLRNGFNEACSYVRSEAAKDEILEDTSSSARARASTTVPPDLVATSSPPTIGPVVQFALADLVSFVQQIRTDAATPIPKVPDAVWHHPDFQAIKHQYLDIVRQLRPANPGALSSARGGGSVPRQYTNPVAQKAHLTEQDEERQELSDGLTEMLAAFSHTHISMVNTRIEPPLDVIVSQHIVALLRDEMNPIATDDSGADTSVIATGSPDCPWKNVSYDEHRKANVSSWDSTAAPLRGLRIGAFDTVVKSDSGKEVIIRVHQAVEHPRSTTTLIAPTQVRSHGVVWDAVHRDHPLDTLGRMGTQAFYPKLNLKISFTMRKGLMTFQSRLPTSKDYEVLDVVDITSPSEKKVWSPSLYNDEVKAQIVQRCKSHKVPPDSFKDEVFFDASQGTAHEWHHSTAFTTRVDPSNVSDEPELYYFDPSDDFKAKNVFGRKVYLTLDRQNASAPYIRASHLDAFIHDLDDDMLFGRTECGIHTRQIYAFNTQHRLSDRDIERIQPHLGFAPLDRIRTTLKNTTQMAKAASLMPMIKHYAARFKWFRHRRLREIIATDTCFSNIQDIRGRKCVQFFFGCTSRYLSVYGMISKKNYPVVVKEFIREEGIPSVIHSDNAPEETSVAVKDIFRDYVIKETTTEPHHPWQNPAETQIIGQSKAFVRDLLARTGAPPFLWLLALEYFAYIHNRLSNDLLDGKTPYAMRWGETPDISPLLNFTFYQKVLYLESAQKFPATRELPGYWVGIEEHVGDILTYRILTADHTQILSRSVVRAADVPGNAHANWDTSHLPPQNIALVLGPSEMKDQRLHPTRSSRRAPLRFHPQPDVVNQPLLPLPPIPDIHPDHINVPSFPEIPLLDSTLPLHDTPAVLERVPVIGETTSVGDVPETTSVGDVPVIGENNSITGNLPVRGENNSMIREPPVIGETASMTSTLWNPRVPLPYTTQIPTEGPIRVSERRRIAPRRLIESAILAAVTISSGLFVNALSLDSFDPSRAIPKAASFDPAEQDFTAASILTAHEVDRLQELQLLDRLNGDTDSDWMVKKVLDSKTSTQHRRLPGTRVSKTSKHTRLFVEFLDGDKKWVQMDAVRLQDPSPVVLFAMERRLLNTPTFHWCRAYISNGSELNEKRQVLAAQTYGAPRFKFGVQLPASVRDAIRLDELNGNTLWQDAMKTELDQINSYETFRLPSDDFEWTGYSRIPYHFVWDCKFDLRRKCRLVLGGNFTEAIDRDEIFSGVIGSESVRLGFLAAEIHSLDCCVADVGNAFLNGLTREKRFIVAGPEFGPTLQGKRLVVYKSCYGLKTSAARFHEHLATKLRKMGFRPSRADNDLWIKHSADGSYDFIATYVDDLAVWSKDPMSIIQTLKADYVLKGVGLPEFYLGGDIQHLPDDSVWHQHRVRLAMSAETYIKNALERLQRLLGTGDFRKVSSPMDTAYHPELEVTSILPDQNASHFRAIIGSLNWIVTLGRMDIAYATNTLARFSMQPRLGHLMAARRVLGYLRNFPQGKIIIDPRTFSYDHLTEKVSEFDTWKEYYPDAIEEIPPNMPPPSKFQADITCFVDADHAHDTVTRRSVTGLILFVNQTPIKWISKRQATVETSTYGSELVAARQAMEAIIEMRYNLRMLGFRIDDASWLFGDNLSVVLNTTMPSSMLKKKHHSCSYHRCREVIAASIAKFIHVESANNVADIMTKPLPPLIHLQHAKKLLFRFDPMRQAI